MGRGRDGESPGSSARDAPHDDVFAHAEALNDLSATYDVTIDGVPLTRLSTVELTKLAATRGLPLSHARHELIAAVAWDEMEKRDLRRVGKDKTKARADETNRRDAVHDKDAVLGSKAGSDKNFPGVVPKPSGMTQINTDTNARLNTASNARGYDEFNVSDEDDDIDIDVGEKENDEFPAPDSYLVGATAVVWEGELYTYGGLTPTGEFVSGILRWSGRGVNVEVQTNSHKNPRDENAKTKNQTSPPGRYGHTAVVVHDGLWIFGGQGQFGCLDDLWRFDFITCEWHLVRSAGGAPPAPRTNHCACVCDDVMFVFGGKDVQPGKDVISFDDLFGYDFDKHEWLAIETRWRKPLGGVGCAMTSTNGVLYVLSPSETYTEMLVWCLQLGAVNKLRWTQVPRSGTLPSPRVDYAASVFGHNWIIHGGRVLLRDGALGDTYAFHFPTAEWGRFHRESDTDPRFGHCGAAVDGALVLLHGTRDRHAANSLNVETDFENVFEKDTGECVAVDLTSFLMFPEFSTEAMDNEVFDVNRHGHLSTVEEQTAQREGTTLPRETFQHEDDDKKDKGADHELSAFEKEGFPKMNAKLLGKLNKMGVGEKGGLMGGSLHVGRKGSHAPGDVELVSGNGKTKLHAHRDIIEDASPGLKKLMEQRPLAAALRRREDLVERVVGGNGLSPKTGAFLGQILGLVLHLAHVICVFVSFGFRAALEKGTGKTKVTLVFPPEVTTATLVAMLRWMYRIPLHPPLHSLIDLHDAATKYEVKGLAAYCEQRLLAEMRCEIAAGAARVAKTKHISGLWKVATRCARSDWTSVAASPGMTALVTTHPEIAAQFAFAVHDAIRTEIR